MTKVSRILEYLARGRALTRFDAEALGDHVLPSTVSRLERYYGIRVERHMVERPGFNGSRVRCARYRIETKAERDRARRVLTTMRKGAG